MNTQSHVNFAYVVNDCEKRKNGREIPEKAESRMDVSAKLQSTANYDPYLHRTVAHPLSNTETFIHLLKASLGTGILAMPQAIHHAGYIMGPIGTVVIGLICLYCLETLLGSHYELCKRRKVPCLDYPTIVKYAVLEGPVWTHRFAALMKHTTNALILINQIGTACIYVVFISGNLRLIILYVTNTEIEIRWLMVIILLPLILVNWVRNLKYLAPFSTLANLVTVISFTIIFYFILRDPIVTEGRRPVGPISEWPFFFGTVLFSMESIGVIMPCENEMKTPKSYVGPTGVLSRAYGIIFVLFTAMGLLGYLKYGDDVKESIIWSLESNSHLDGILSHSVLGMLTFGIYVTHALTCYVTIDISWNKYINQRIPENHNKLIWEYVVRTGVVLITFLLAVAIPKLDLYISLLGALCASLLGLGFPAIIESLVYSKTKTGCAKYVMIAKNILIFVFAIFALVIGTFTSIRAIVNSFLE